MKFVIGIDVACRAPHVAAGADEQGVLVFTGVRFRTRVEELESLWRRIPKGVDEVIVVMEPTRNAWVPLASWLRRQGVTVVMVPPEQSADLRNYFSKHARNDRLDAQLLARLPSMHREGLHTATGDGPAEPLRRACRQRVSLVMRRATCMNRLDAMLEIMGPGWTEALGSALTLTDFKFLAKWAHPLRVQRLGRARLARWFSYELRKPWGGEVADKVLDAARATLELWGHDGLDYDELASDIAVEAEIALEFTRQIKQLDRRINDLYLELDPERIAMSAPGVGEILAALNRPGNLGGSIPWM
ncbi:MAG: transposase [Acidimicrobiaceae bacterium]|nr:transposase [Acidimicrobiaceae bacterium]